MPMIDENLCRAELSPAQAAYQVARRKEIYEALHPEAKRGTAGAIGSNRAQGNATADSAIASFVADAAAKTGRAERTIRQDSARGEALGEDLNRIAGTSLDKGVEIDALALGIPRAPVGTGLYWHTSTGCTGMLTSETNDRDLAVER